MSNKATQKGKRVENSPAALRIGEAAQLCGVTTRTLRYWQEVGLLAPGGQEEGRERLYLPSDLARATRIKELQDLLGFSLSEIRAVLYADDVLDELRTAYHSSARPEVQLQLVEQAIDANAKLLERLDDTLERVRAFREERAQKGRRMKARARELRGDIG